MVLDNKKAFLYILWSNLYLPLILLYIVLQEKYVDFKETSSSLIYFYILIITEVLNVLHFKIAFGIVQTSNKKIVQGMVNKLCNIKISELIQSFLTVLLSIVVFAVMAIIFGANIASNHEQTLIFASLLSVLTVLPSCIHFNAQSAISLLSSGQYANNINLNQQKIVLQKFYCSMLGVWLGAFVIPLDWNRDWQTWPIPCCLGALVGTSVGQLMSVIYLNDALGYKSSLLGKSMKRTR